LVASHAHQTAIAAEIGESRAEKGSLDAAYLCFLHSLGRKQPVWALNLFRAAIVHIVH
jgi:hypothetical protein